MTAYNTFTLTGRHTTPSGVAHAGRVIVTPNTEIRDTSGKVILSGAERVTLDDSGAWSITLPCDGPTLNPSSGIGYQVGFALHSTSLKPKEFAAVPELAGTTLDVAYIATSSTPIPTYDSPAYVSATVGPDGSVSLYQNGVEL